MLTKNAQPSILLVSLAFATVYLVWGSTYFFIQQALSGFTPFVLGSIRFILAGLIMLAWCIFKGENIWTRAGIKVAFITGLLLLFVANGIVIWVEQFLPSAMVAIMVSSAPLWFVLLDHPKWRENFASLYTVLGLVMGFCGVVLLFWQQIAGTLHILDIRTPLALGLLVLGSVCWAGGSLYSKYHPTNSPAIVSTAWQMLFAGLAFIPGGFIGGEWAKFNLGAVPLHAWAALLYLVLMGSIAAFSAYVWLLQVRPATQVSTYAYVNPVIAVILGLSFGHEHIGMLQIAGLAIILVSVLLINLHKYRAGKNY